MYRTIARPAGLPLFILFLVLPVSVLTASPAAEADYLKDVSISNIDVSKVPDGTFIGNFIRDEIAYRAKVIVADGRIESIDIGEINPGPASEKAMAVADDVLRANSVRVKPVRGAETSSKAILKAIELALQAGLKTQQ